MRNTGRHKDSKAIFEKLMTWSLLMVKYNSNLR